MFNLFSYFEYIKKYYILINKKPIFNKRTNIYNHGKNQKSFRKRRNQ
jgi:hypothetical protein